MISNRTKQRWDYYAMIEEAKEIRFLKAYREAIEKGYGEAFEKAYLEAFKKGFRKGFEKEMAKTAVKMARKLKEKGLSIEEIAELTELSVAEIESL